MLPVILLCMLLLKAFCTCSPITVEVFNSDGQPQILPSAQVSLEDIKTSIITASESVECPTLFLSRLVALDQVAERCWSMCLDKMSAYSHNQDFFTNTLPAFVDEIQEYPVPRPPLQYTVDTLFMYAKIFCQEQSSQAYLKDLNQLAKAFKSGGSPFEGLSDEFFTSVADYIRSTINVRKLYSMVEDPYTFANIQPQTLTQSARFQKKLLHFLVSLNSLVKGLQKVNLMGTYHHFLSAIKVARRTMVAANKVFLDPLTVFDIRHIPLLAEKASKAIGLPSDDCGLSTSANNILIGIEAITVPLYRSSFDLYSELTEQRGRGQVLWNSFFESLFAFESIFAKPGFDPIRKISETFSELTSHLLDTFLRGEDELWTLELEAKLEKTEALWRRVLEISAFPSDLRQLIFCSNYISVFWADLSIIFHIITVVEELEDPLALDRPTREKLVEFWREAQTLWRLVRSLSVIETMAEYFERMAKVISVAAMKESLSLVLDEQINAVQRQGINFHVGKYPQFINELPEHQEAIAQLLKKFSDNLSYVIVNDATASMVKKILLSLKSPIYTPLKQSLKQLFTSASPLTQPQNLLPHPAKSSNKQSRRRGNKSKGSTKRHKAAVSKPSPSTDMQVFVHNSTQYVDGVPECVEDGLKLLEENFEKSWILVVASWNRQTFGNLASQPAREVLKRFAGKPMGWDGALSVDLRDMRKDKETVKIAAFNVEWLFLFDLFTSRPDGKIKWKSLKEAWDHIRDVANAIRRIDADIICLCEVQDLRVLSILVELLPELGYRAYLIPSHDSLGQNVGILTRVDTHVSISRIDDWSFPKNIVLHLKLDNGWGDLVDLVVAGVHLISSTAESDHAGRARHREDQARALKHHLATNYGTSEQIIHLVLGDFNMVDPELPSAQPAELPEEALQVVKHEEFDLFNAMDPSRAPSNSSSLPSGVCHIFTSHPNLVADARVVSLNDESAPCRLERVSDHLPVVATINLPKHSQ